MAKTDLSAERLRELFDYNPDTGIFTRRISLRGRKCKAGQVLDCPDHEGYLQVCIDWGKYKVHRLAWLYVHGTWPSAHIDHINGVKTDNRIDNLREATDAFNQQNRSAKGGTLGTRKVKSTGKWTAGIGFNWEYHRLGYFDSQEEAHNAYLEAKKKLHTFNPTPR